MTLSFLGVGSAFSTVDYYQSNLLVTARNGKKMLIDCGSDARFSLVDWGRQHGVKNLTIDAVYASHLHADHIGGLEWLAFSTYFNPSLPRPKIFAVEDVLNMLWSDSLRGGLGYINDKAMILSNYFEPCPLEVGKPFQWENIWFTPLKMLHVQNSYRNVYSYGLVIQAADSEDGPAYFFSSDAMYCPELVAQLHTWAPQVTLLFQDAETLPFRTNVHAHYEDLCTLPDAIREKMWLYHYNPNPPFNPREAGFRGFVKKGQMFDL